MSTQPQWSPPVLRGPDEIAAMIEFLNDPRLRTTGGGMVHSTAAQAALRWVLGEIEAAPVSGTVLGHPVSGTEAVREQYAAYGVAGGDDPVRRRELGMDYLMGVENALSWATGGEGLGEPAEWPWRLSR